MAEAFKPLLTGDGTPAAATLTDLYTVPGATTAVVTAVYVTNRSSTATTFRISVAPAGAVDAVDHYIYYDAPIPGNETFQFGPLALETTDVLRVYATLATVTFSAFGLEIT